MGETRSMAGTVRRLRTAITASRVSDLVRRQPLTFAAILLASGFWLLRSSSPAPEVHGIASRWLAARHAVPVGQPVTAFDFLARERAAVVDGITDQQLPEIGERRTVRPLEEGDLLRWTDLEKAPQTLSRRIPKGTRAFPLPDPLSFPAVPGDRLDLSVSAPAGSEAEPRTLASGVPILSVDAERRAVVAVSPQSVRVLDAAIRAGALVTTLRHPEDHAAPATAHRTRKKKRSRVLLLEEGT